MLAGSRPWAGEGFMGAMFKVGIRTRYQDANLARTDWLQFAQLGAERMRPPLPPDIELSENADHFVGECLQMWVSPLACIAHRPVLTTIPPSL